MDCEISPCQIACASWSRGDCSIQHHKVLSECQLKHLYNCSTIDLLSTKFRRNCTFRTTSLHDFGHVQLRKNPLLCFFSHPFFHRSPVESWRWRSLRSIRHSVAVKVKFGIVSMATGALVQMSRCIKIIKIIKTHPCHRCWDWSNFPVVVLKWKSDCTWCYVIHGAHEGIIRSCLNYCLLMGG